MSNKYALQVQGAETRNANGEIIGEEGEWYWVLEDREKWVAASSISVNSMFSRGTIPADALLFSSAEKAAQFARKWKGHPWWCRPNGNFLAVAVKPVTVQRVIGYRKV